MYSKLIVLSVAAACVFAAPPTDVVPLEKQQPTVIPIISQSDELEANGTYKFSYETGNGIKREEEAYEKILPKAEGRSHSGSNEGGESDEDSNEIHVQRGSYSYTAPDGTVITLSYIADENGFQPIGKHLPRVPVPAQGADASSEKASRALKLASDSKASASKAKIQANFAPAPESIPAAAPESTSAVAPESTSVAALESTPAPAPESTPAPGPESTSAPAAESTPASAMKESATEGINESTTNAASGENSAESASTVIPSQPTSAENTEAPISTIAPGQVTTSSNEQQTTINSITDAASQSAEIETPSTNEPKTASEEATTVSA